MNKTEYTDLENSILLTISEYCVECEVRESCVEDECVLFRIEKIVLKESD